MGFWTGQSQPNRRRIAAQKDGSCWPFQKSHEVLEGCILAVSSQSTANANTNNSVPGAPNRVSFAKLREPLEVPGLLDVQTDSFEWLIGSDRWREKEAAPAG